MTSLKPRSGGQVVHFASFLARRNALDSGQFCHFLISVKMPISTGILHFQSRHGHHPSIGQTSLQGCENAMKNRVSGTSAQFLPREMHSSETKPHIFSIESPPKHHTCMSLFCCFGCCFCTLGWHRGRPEFLPEIVPEVLFGALFGGCAPLISSGKNQGFCSPVAICSRQNACHRLKTS